MHAHEFNSYISTWLKQVDKGWKMQFRFKLQPMIKMFSHQYKRIQMYPMSMQNNSAAEWPPFNEYFSIAYIW